MLFENNFRNALVIIFTPLIIGFFAGSSDASNQCKNKVMNIVIKMCSDTGGRNKRDLEGLSAGSYSGDKFVHHVRRRQVEERTAEPPIVDVEVPPNPETAEVPGVYVGDPPSQTKFVGLIDQESNFGGELGFELSIDEVNDLYEELAERLPRELKNDDIQKMFFRLAAECCRHDVDSCFESNKLLKCV
ncbi:uncharacterized protein LOC107037148 [Diachasma alloeum]|uniref:uncharacterized protein LOC107037148 n=1 Tax=Diachasma alloeum TaxID=454923 RepID=UPI000738100D|nr:uncharacterized protein LOC107037148 [Diachasma alloeum]